jgi:hypothetical protein
VRVCGGVTTWSRRLRLNGAGRVVFKAGTKWYGSWFACRAPVMLSKYLELCLPVPAPASSTHLHEDDVSLQGAT